MIVDRSHLSWGGGTFVATGVAAVLYCGVFHPAWVPWLHLPDSLAQPRREHASAGHSTLGLAYGIIAYAIFIFAVLLNVRRRFPTLRIGRAQSWLRAHIWLTILTLPLVFLHAAFHFGGLMTSSLMWLYLLVMASGFYGLALQQFLPRHMKERLTLETIYDEIPFLTQRLRATALELRDELRTASSASLGELTPARSLVPAGAIPPAADDLSVSTLLEALEEDVLPYLRTRRPRRAALADLEFAEKFFGTLRLRVSPAYREQVDVLARLCFEYQQMQVQARYHQRLHRWLLVHVPSSFLLIILTGWHAVATLILY